MFVITVPIACVIGVVKYDRVSCGKRSIPKLFRIDRADADVAESAARGIALQRGLQAAGKGGSGTGSKKKPETTGQAKRSSKAAGGAGAATGRPIGALDTLCSVALCCNHGVVAQKELVMVIANAVVYSTLF